MSWREVSDEYDDYMTSLGPWPVSSVIDFIKEEWPDLQCEDVIAQFIQSDSETLSILSDS
ncbi:MAG: hypothetical protein HYY30_02685 [Chloroflexi bacterium]|nr:hypothetical protein [Chloroflexota bacterium]